MKPHDRNPQTKIRMRKKHNGAGLLLGAGALLGLAGILPLAASTGQDGLPGMGVQPVEYFYTGKPYDADSESYTFRYRNYDPELNRWTTVDPSGFPDGVNNQYYAPNPLVELDWQGLQTISSSHDLPALLGESFSIERSLSATFTDGPFFTGPARLQGSVAGFKEAHLGLGANVSFSVSSPSVEFVSITAGPIVSTGNQTTKVWNYTAQLEATVSLTFTADAGFDLKPYGIGIKIGAGGSHTENFTFSSTFSGSIETVE